MKTAKSWGKSMFYLYDSEKDTTVKVAIYSDSVEPEINVFRFKFENFDTDNRYIEITEKEFKKALNKAIKQIKQVLNEQATHD